MCKLLALQGGATILREDEAGNRQRNESNGKEEKERNQEERKNQKY
jgi:hypothetical protein